MNTTDVHIHPTVVVYVSLGSNIEPRAKTMSTALALMEKIPGVIHLRKSTVYETSPVNMSDNSGAFLNQVVSFETTLDPTKLLVQLQSIEKQLGRIDKGSYRARTIDLDLLYFGDLKINTERLEIPHPRLTERLFVLAPLLELEPELVDPISGHSLRALYEQLNNKENANLSNNQPPLQRAK